MKRLSILFVLSGAVIALSIAGITSTFAAPVSCSTSYTVKWGDTLSSIAASHATTWQDLQRSNGLINAGLIFPGQTLCLARTNMSIAIKGTGNYFSYPQCTWGASQKYHALHGIWVPWTTQSDAYQWTERARQFHWTVSDTPQVGDIFVLAPHQQGAYGLGHVGVVLGIKGKMFEGTSTNWYPNYYSFTNVEYTVGVGTTFLRF